MKKHLKLFVFVSILMMLMLACGIAMAKTYTETVTAWDGSGKSWTVKTTPSTETPVAGQKMKITYSVTGSKMDSAYIGVSYDLGNGNFYDDYSWDLPSSGSITVTPHKSARSMTIWVGASVDTSGFGGSGVVLSVSGSTPLTNPLKVKVTYTGDIVAGTTASIKTTVSGGKAPYYSSLGVDFYDANYNYMDTASFFGWDDGNATHTYKVPVPAKAVYMSYYANASDDNGTSVYAGSGEDTIPVCARTSSITMLTTKTIYITAEKPNPTYVLKPTIKPANASTSLKWTSGNTDVLTVSSTGKLTALKPGVATITASAKDGSGVKAQCKVTVKNKPISAITLNMTTKTLTISADKLNPTYVLKPTVEPADAVYSSLKWTTGNADVVTVTSTGKFTARKAGVATITVSANGVKAQCKVTVKNLLVKTITLNLTKKTLTITSSTPHPTWMLRPTVEPANAVNTGVKFTSSNTSVATVSTTGKVTAVAPGTATITVTAKDGSGVKAVCTVTVK